MGTKVKGKKISDQMRMIDLRLKYLIIFGFGVLTGVLMYPWILTLV